MKLRTKLRRALRGLNGYEEVNRRLIHPLLTVALLAVFFLTALTSLPVSADAATSGTTNGLNGVWGNSRSDVFAVGQRGTILHYDGSAWSAMASGTTSRLNGVWGSSSSDVFAVGGAGTILHYNGSFWSAMTSGTTDNLWGVRGSSSSDVFAVGGYGTILYYNGITILHHIEATTIRIVASSANPSVHGQSVTFTVTVSPTAPAAHTPSGTVIFKGGTTTLGYSTLSDGMATYSTSMLPVGNHSITAVYGGDTNFASSTSSASTQTVDATPVNWGLISGITVGAVVVIAALVYFLVIRKRVRRAKINWFLVGLVIAVVVASIAVVTIVPSIACQQEQWGSDGILFGFYGGGITREPATETLVQISVAHTCVFNDELILEKVEIYGESEIPVKSLAVNMTLTSVSGKLIRLDGLLILQQLVLWIPGAYLRIMQEGAKLAEEIRAESFSTGYFTIDLRQIKKPPNVGDIIPIVAKATLIHNGKRLTLERVVIVKYQQSLVSK